MRQLAAALFTAAALSACAPAGDGVSKNGETGGDAFVSPSSCRTDVECDPDFCDLGVCVAPQSVYGSFCEPAPRGPDGKIDGKLNTCGAYLCKEGRCRSCDSDLECREAYGAPRCTTSPGRPGKRCGA